MLKGTRDALELIAAAGFISCIAGPITGCIASAGLAFGLRDLRKAEAAPRLENWHILGEIFAWCACALMAVSFIVPFAALPAGLADLSAWFAATSALRLLARTPATASLERWFAAMRWIVLAPAALLLLLLTPLALSMTVREMPAGLVISILPGLVLAILALRLRKAALPYGKRVRRRTLPSAR
jgi:hypothetical protein